MSLLLVTIAVFIGVTALVGSVAFLLQGDSSAKVEDRLDLLTGAKSQASQVNLAKQSSVLAQPLDAIPGFAERWINKFTNVNVLFEQADTSLTVSRMLAIMGFLGLVGAGAGAALRIHPSLLPVLAAFMGLMPVVWLLWRRRKRLKVFASQLPDALELIARALRAGQSLPAGFSMVSSEMSAPISQEFGRVFEEQNFGCSMEDSLRDLAKRIPNTDLKFFVTAIILQRQTGGDLAEILDKIGRLIRERFQIWGQIQALTGEGRLSGAVLLALPFVLFVVVYQMNPDYVKVLFTEPMGKQMLAGALVMQLLGALTIRKIINIRV